MVTKFNCINSFWHAFCSEPTVWDGDTLYDIVKKHFKDSSEPTVWDGDSIKQILKNLSFRSEPTVWDGDTVLAITQSLFACAF